MSVLRCPICRNTFDNTSVGRREHKLCTKGCTEYVLSGCTYQIGTFLYTPTLHNCYVIKDVRVEWIQGPNGSRRDLVYGLKTVSKEDMVSKLVGRIIDVRNHVLRVLNQSTERDTRLLWYKSYLITDRRFIREIRSENDFLYPMS